MLGEVALLTGVPRTSTVSAIGQVNAISLPGATVRELTELHNELKDGLLKLVQDRANHTISQIPTSPS